MSRIMFHNGRRMVEGMDWLDVDGGPAIFGGAREDDIVIVDDVVHVVAGVSALRARWHRVTLAAVDVDDERRKSMREAGLASAVTELGEAVKS